ncbi:MAG: heme-copper oxidase subunit III [Bdellovibrionales bacterium]|jgi:cytochrome c oxidase subunit 3|nr:heme-copper oxidase subunit III [Bdellovibrionales bacterium]
MSSHHGPITDLKHPNDKQFGEASPGKIGMWLFLGTDAMSFSGLLIAYAVLRGSKPWPDPVEALGGVELSAFMTFILICSSVSMVLSIDACKMGDRNKMLKWLKLTIFGGVIFLGIQVYEYYHLIYDLGLTLTPWTYKGEVYSHFGSTFFAITGFHGLHVLTGVIYLIVMYGLARNGRFDNANYNQLEIAGLFWHFVDLVWILVFTFIYLL